MLPRKKFDFEIIHMPNHFPELIFSHSHLLLDYYDLPFFFCAFA